MIEQSKRLEFWNYLTAEKNQPRPKGLTVQRLAVIKPLALAADLWTDVIERHGADAKTAREFYASTEASAVQSRTAFWEAVRGIIRREEAVTKRLIDETVVKTLQRNQAATRADFKAIGKNSVPHDRRDARKARKTQELNETVLKRRK